MAGEWIKVEHATPNKTEIFTIAHELDIDPDAVVGKLVKVWSWASQNCHVDGVTNVTGIRAIDSVAGVQGFADAMRIAGWLIVSDTEIQFTHHDRHCSNTAKERALAAERKRRQRALEKEKESRFDRDSTVTREEKRREDINTPPIAPKGKGQNNLFGDKSKKSESSEDGTNATAYTQEFEVAWGIWPNKKSKANAFKAFKKAKKRTTVNVILETIKNQKRTHDWKKDGGRYIPLFSSWLNADGWENDIASMNRGAPEYKEAPELIACVHRPDGTKTWPRFKSAEQRDAVMDKKGYVYDDARELWHKRTEASDRSRAEEIIHSASERLAIK